MEKLAKVLIAFAISMGMSFAIYAQEFPLEHRVIMDVPEFKSNPDVLKAEESESSKFDSGESPLAAAPPLTSIWVHGVFSPQCGEEFTRGKISTSCQHGGGVLRVAVVEIGYGLNDPWAWISGNFIPSSSIYSTIPVCISGGSYYWPCSRRSPVVGFVRIYNLDRYGKGMFKYQNTSMNRPGNTVSISLNIR